MKLTLVCLLLMLILAGFPAALSAQAAPAQAPPVHKHDMESHDSPSAPSPAHAQLMKLAGEYTVATTFTFRPGEKPIESAGVATLTPSLGSRFLVEHNSGSMMGQEVEGTRIYGYNNGTGNYEAVWIYTSSTGIMNLVGANTDDKTIVYKATYDDDRGAHRTVQVTLHLVDDDHFQIELSGKNPDGSQGPVLRESYSRKK